MRHEQNKTLLLVEDEVIIAQSEKKQLENIGYKIVLAYNGEEAINIFKQNDSIDLILMDINLGPGVDGAEVGKTILEYKNVPLVFWLFSKLCG